MMDRNREPRRGAMAAVNGGVSRRRSRSSSLRDSPEEDGATETQEAARLRDRGSKKDRDRDRSTRSKRRRGDRMVHGSHREEGEDSSEESVDDEEDDEEDDASVAVRLPALPAANMAPSASMMQSHHVRKGFPAKPARPPGTGSWKVVEEMIGAPIPRKARSSSVKRSPECWVSGGGAGGEQVHRQASTSPARPSPPSTAPVSPSSSNASVRKKMKPICGTKHRPPKTSKASSSIQEIEIEVAEVLFGMTRQVPPKQESYKHDSKESNGSGNEVKSRVSSPIPLSSLPANSQSSAMPHSLASNSTPLTTTAPKRKRPRMRFEEENPTSPPNSVALPAISTCSVAKSEKEAPPPASSAGTKTEATSAKLEKNMASPAVETGGVTSDPAASNASSALVTPDLLLEPVKPEDNSDVDPKDPEDRLEKKAKEEAVSPRANLDVNPEEPPASKAPPVSESPREEKFSIDLMAPPPGKASPERESASDFVAERKPAEMEMVPSVELTKADGEKMEKNSKTEDGGVAQDDRKTRKPVAEDYELKQPIKERNLDLQLDLEKPEKDIAGASKPQAQKQQPRAPRADSKLEKTGPSSSIPLPMQVTSWPGGFPPFG
ncbi:Protein time for coffee [Apostasia shenzhenica]|uniref:Protein time for coffee n=1 Tax=Apostasia shenzhenica TaxID=1088818 RepID=A0A2I0ARS4_9ASPA|nr:Protein time for coffee [Apostasia shenzhenica]